MAIVLIVSYGTKNTKMKHQEKLLVILERKLHVSVNTTDSKISRQLHKNGMTYVNHLLLPWIQLY